MTPARDPETEWSIARLLEARAGLSRRRFLAVAGGTLVLAACGDDATPTPTQTSSPTATPTQAPTQAPTEPATPSPTATTAPTQAPTETATPSPTATDSPATRVFVDSTGASVTVPAQPQRVVTVGAPQWGAAQVLSLGVPLVGAGNFEGTEWPDYIANYFDMEGIAGVGWAGDTDVEAIVGLRPDLIIVPARQGEVEADTTIGIDQLTPIAPVAAVDPFRPVDEVMADFATLLGVDPSVLDAQRAEYAAVFGQIQALLGDGWGEVDASNLWAGGDTAEAWGPTDLPMNAILTELGVRWTDIVNEAQAAGGWLNVSLERLSEFDCDLMLYGNTYGDLEGNPLFESLKVVQAGQYIPFPTFTFDGTHYPNYIACAKYILEQLQPMQPLRTDIIA